MNSNENKDISEKYLEVLAQNKISKSPVLSLHGLQLTGNEPELADFVSFTWVEENLDPFKSFSSTHNYHYWRIK